MSGNRMKKTRVRDLEKCGVHLGGCGEIVNEKKERSLDHIIPQAWFKSTINATENDLEIATSTDYNDLWNRQLMHKRCDNNLGGHVHGLPPFCCHCHYLKVVDEDLFVVVRDSVTAENPESYLLLKGYVFTPNDNPRSVGLFTSPLSSNPKSWPKDGMLVLEAKNHHHLVMLRPEMVDSFNRQQLTRADRVFEAYKGTTPDFSIRDISNVWDKDISKFAPRKSRSWLRMRVV